MFRLIGNVLTVFAFAVLAVQCAAAEVPDLCATNAGPEACRRESERLKEELHMIHWWLLWEMSPTGIVRLTGSDLKNLQSKALRLQVGTTRPGRRLELV